MRYHQLTSDETYMIAALRKQGIQCCTSWPNSDVIVNPSLVVEEMVLVPEGFMLEIDA